MTSYKTSYLDALWDDPKLRSHVMAVTTIAPKFLGLLDYISNVQTQDEIITLVSTLKCDCLTLLSYYNNYLTGNLHIPNEALEITRNLFYLYDDITVSDSIENKIKAWKISYLMALRQVQNEVPLKIVFQPQPAVNPSELEPPDYPEIKEELTEYYDEFCAWSDIHYIEEPLLYQKVVNALETLIDLITQ